VYLLVILGAATAMLVVAQPVCTTSPADYAAGRLPAWALAGFRALSFVFCVAVLISRVSHENGADEETLDRRPVHLISHSFWRMQGLTQWQFLTIALYFGLSSYLTLCSLRASTAASQPAWLLTPSTLACATETVLGVAFGLAVLTTIIVTFVLVPAKIRNGTSAKHFFRWDELCMHNANSFLLVLDLLAGHLSIHTADLPYCIIVGALYVVFHHYVRYPHTRTLLYYFLNWQHPKAPLILVVLLAAIAAFFAVGSFVSNTLRQTAYGPYLVLAVSLFIMRVRDPTPPAHDATLL